MKWEPEPQPSPRNARSYWTHTLDLEHGESGHGALLLIKVDGAWYVSAPSALVSRKHDVGPFTLEETKLVAETMLNLNQLPKEWDA